MLAVLGVSVGVAHPVGELKWMPRLVLRPVVTVMEGQQVAEDEVLDE